MPGSGAESLSLFGCEELRGPMDNQGICLGPWVHELQGQKQLHSRQWTKQNPYRVAGIFSNFAVFFLKKNSTPRWGMLETRKPNRSRG